MSTTDRTDPRVLLADALDCLDHGLPAAALENARLAVVALEGGVPVADRRVSDDTLRQEESDRLAHASSVAQMRRGFEDRERELSRVIGPPPTESEALGRAVEDGDLEY
jgi:hypothetical protein